MLARILMQGSATDTLDSLAREFQQLPIASLAPALVLLLGGLLLLIAGRHFLRPVLVVTAVLVCAMLAPSLLGGVFPSIHGTVLAVLGGLFGLASMALAWRLVLGAATGLIAAFACAVLAMLAVDAGWIDARSPNDALAPGPTQAEIDAHNTLVARSPEVIHPLVEWADSRWLAEPKQVRTLLTAAGAGAGFVGLVLGAWMPQSAAALLTSLVGSILTLVGAVPFLAKHSDRIASGPHPIGWLLLWLALALAGWLFQTSRAAKAQPSARTAHGRPGHEG
jgi:hypothetical protein